MELNNTPEPSLAQHFPSHSPGSDKSSPTARKRSHGDMDAFPDHDPHDAEDMLSQDSDNSTSQSVLKLSDSTASQNISAQGTKLKSPAKVSLLNDKVSNGLKADKHVPESDTNGHAESGQNHALDHEEHSEETLTEPNDPLPNFDWYHFETDYHAMIKRKQEDEDCLLHDFQALCKYFKVWAETASSREVDRSFKRLKTQSAYVQHQEMDLERRRLHCKVAFAEGCMMLWTQTNIKVDVNVVTAFQAALSLLNT